MACEVREKFKVKFRLRLEMYYESKGLNCRWCISPDVLGVVPPYAHCAGAEEALRRPPLCKDDPCMGRGGEPLKVT